MLTFDGVLLCLAHGHGSAVLGSALTTALGLSGLIFSPALARQEHGNTAAVLIGYALIVSALLATPAMTVWGAY